MKQKGQGSFLILEMSQHDKITGRTGVKFVMHEIFDKPSDYNKNGISWNEQYVNNNLNSAQGMPLCVEFVDWERSEPFGHGLTGIQDNQPIYENSTMVGVIQKAYIDTVTLPNRESIKALVGEGYVNEQRYPKFVQWLKAQKYDNKPIESSVEVSPKAGNQVIIYDGGWKEFGRIPQIYDYTGHAILGIEPADDTAVLLELNQHRQKKEEIGMNENEKLILELNNKIEAKAVQVTELNNQIKTHDTLVSELNAKIEALTKELNEANAKAKAKAPVDPAEPDEDDKVSKNSKKPPVDPAEPDEDDKVATNAKLEKAEVELNELRKFKQEVVNKDLINELNSKLAIFSDEEKEAVKDKVETFSANPSKDGIDAIVFEVNNAIVAKIIEARKTKQSSEQNNHLQAPDIESDIYETNSLSDKDLSDELY